VEVVLTEDCPGLGKEGEVVETTFPMAQALIRAEVAKVSDSKGGEKE